jgi:formylglycine-generating enzyme required for sulfatase activity
MVVIPAGSFTMGSPLWEYGRQENEGPRRSVSVRQFAAGKFELTFAQWSACVDRGGCVRDAVDRDSGAGRRNYPVRNVSWHDVQQYVRWLSVETGEEYRLLSEAEWEYAARAGTTTTYSTGAWIRHSQANFGGSIGPQPVGSYAANAFGLYDMHGNMWEWVQDCYRDSYRGLPTDGSAHDQTACTLRVSRGGSWGNGPRVLRSAIRLERRPDGRSDLFGGILGVRVARTLP